MFFSLIRNKCVMCELLITGYKCSKFVYRIESPVSVWAIVGTIGTFVCLSVSLTPTELAHSSSSSVCFSCTFLVIVYVFILLLL